MRQARTKLWSPVHGSGARPRARDGWVYEEKVDGWRMLAYDGRAVRLESRGGEVLDLLEHHMARQPSVPPVAGRRLPKRGHSRDSTARRRSQMPSALAYGD
jgi:hypothetical protein